MIVLYIFLSPVLIIFLLKIYIKSTTGMYYGKEKLHGKTIVVTGANSGIGFVATKDFAMRGARIVMVCRNAPAAENARHQIITSTGNSNISIKYIDFGSLETVRKCANQILAEEPRIDVLLNNAGVAATKIAKSTDEMSYIMQCNYFGVFLFTNILLGRIKESAPSRIVNTSTMVHPTGYIELNKESLMNPNECFKMIYPMSKLALVSFTNELARRLKGTGVTANSLHPGVIPTKIMSDSNPYFRYYWFNIMPFFSKNVAEGAQTSIFLCISPKVENVSGEYFQDCKLSSASSKAKDIDVAYKLWQVTEEIVQLQPHEVHY